MTVSLALQQVASHPRCNELARLTRDSLFEAAGGTGFDPSGPAAQRAAEVGLAREDAQLELGNVLDALSPAAIPTSGPLLGMLTAYAMGLDPPRDLEAARHMAAKLAWLGAHAGIDAYESLDAAAGEHASALWNATADLLAEHDTSGGGFGRADAIVASAALAATQNETAQERRVALASSIRIPMLARLLSRTGTPSSLLAGELSAPPRGPVATFVLGLFGWLLVSHVARLFGRFALQYRRPAEVSITAEGVKVRSTTKLLGKVVRESETLIPLDGLARATREVRFPRLGTYAGLVALAVGSFIGVSWFIDGIRSASFSLAIVGLLVVLAGVALDFALVSLLPGRKGRCRLVFVPRRGSATCVGWVDAAQADLLLKGLAPRG